MKLIFNQLTKEQLNSLAHSLPAAILLSGEPGIGLTSAARYLANQAEADFLLVLPQDSSKQTLGIDEVRELQLKARSKTQKKRLFVIKDANQMSIAAQNAFLKLLEEPNLGTHFALLTQQKDGLLPTVLSRLQKVSLQKINLEQSEALLADLAVDNLRQKTQILFLANGLPAKLTRLASDSKYFEEQVSYLQQARDLLQATDYEQLKIAQNLKSNRAGAIEVLNYALDLAIKTIRQKQVAPPKLIKKINAIEQALVEIEQNANLRLTLAKLIY